MNNCCNGKEKARHPIKENVYACGSHRPLLSSPPSWLMLLLFCVLLVSLSLLAAWGCTGSLAPPGWHIHTCSCKKVCCVSQPNLKSMVEIPGDWHYMGRARKGCRRATTHQQNQYLLLEEEEHFQSPTKWPLAGYWYLCFWPNCQEQTPWGWHEGLTSSGTCVHNPAPCSLINIRKWRPD